MATVGRMTTTYIEDPQGFTALDVNLSHISQDYPEIGARPYSLYYIDWTHPEETEGHEIGDYFTEEEARAAYDYAVRQARDYVKSLLYPVYSFDDYLIISAGGIDNELLY